MNSQQLPLWSPISNQSKFDNFQVDLDSANKLLVESLRQYILQVETTPFFFYGESGSGKTHLHIAAANLSRELGYSNTIYIDCASESTNHNMLTMSAESQCVCLDNIDAWSENEEAEQAIFSVVEQAKQVDSKQCLIISAIQAPKHNNFKLADLVSRLSSGVVFELTSLNDTGKSKALRQRFQERNLNVDDKVIQFLLTHFARDNHSLFSALDMLDKASLIEKRRLTIPFVQKVLSD